MVNNVVLVGRLTRDPELRRTTSGLSVASFTIAVDDSRKGPNGEKVTVFMPVSIFGKSADTVVKFTRKGNLVGVIGRLTQRKYTRRSDNVEITSTEVIATNIEFMEPKSSNGANDSGYYSDPNTDSSPASIAQPQESKDTDSIDIIDDDLPF